MAGGHSWLGGQLLLDGGNLAGSFFHRTVVLICQHDAEGAFGLVLNRPAEGCLGDLVTIDLPESLRGEPVYVGGPVQPSAFSYLHTDELLLQANVMPQVALGHSLEELVEVAEGGLGTGKVRVFAGYSGWSAGQLESEMRRGAWLKHPATVDLVFREDPARLWKRILEELGGPYRLLASAPEDLSWN
jgi:putative transcriptional regulator